jgi:hypothetical protein
VILGSLCRVYERIRKDVNKIVRADYTDPKYPPPKGDMRWLKQCPDRNIEYRRRNIRPIELDRRQTHESEAIQALYDRLESAIQEKVNEFH